MISEVFRKFIDDHKSGLGIVELPTSIGKTFSTFECIAKYTQEWAEYKSTHKRNGEYRQIIVVTPLKKNLQNSNEESEELDGLEKAYDGLGRRAYYKEEVLFLDSITEILRKNSNLLNYPGKKIPAFIQQMPSFGNLQNKIKLFEAYDYFKNDREFTNKINEEARKGYSDFRGKICQAYKQEKNINETPTLTDIADKEGYDWIFRLFPDLLIPRCKVMLMSFKKLIDGRVYEKPSCAFMSDQFLKNKIIFIDEFDSTKHTIKDSLAEKQSKGNVDFLQLFNTIYSGSKNLWLSDTFLQIDSTFEERHNLQKLVEIAERRRSDYMLDHAYQTSDDMKNGAQTFIFNDNATRTISKISSGLQLIVRETGRGRASLMMCRSTEKKDGDFYLEATIRWITGFLKQFANYTLHMATRYARQQNEKRKDGNIPQLSMEDAFCSYLYQYNISRDEMVLNAQTKFLFSLSDASNISRKTKRGELRQGYDFYLDGFTYYSLLDGAHHNDNTIISMVDIPHTAESMLAKMSNNALVIGLSATAAIPSATGNYNLEWIEENINDYIDVISEYPEIDEEVANFLHQRHQPYREGNIKVCTHVIDNGKIAQNKENLYGDGLGTPAPALSEFKEKTAITIEKYIHGSLINVNPKEIDYCVLRYYNLMKVIKDFAQRKHMQSLLYMGTKAAEGNEDADVSSGGDKFDKWVIKRIIKAVNYELGLEGHEKISCDYLYSMDFEASKERIRRRLADTDENGKPKVPERLVIISAYQSIATGQNLQYCAPSMYAQHCCKLVPRGGQNESSYIEKDIDGIYLGDITNLVSNFVKGKLTEKELIGSIFQAEELTAANEISPETKEDSIQSAFNHLNETFSEKNVLRDCESIRSERTRTVIQAVGRIGRSNMRCKEINIYIDSSVLNGLHLPTLKRRYKTPEMDALIQEYIRSSKTILDDDTNKILNKAASTSDNTAEVINRRRSSANHEGEWEPEIMKWWQDIREIVKKYPTASCEEYQGNEFIKESYIDNGGTPVNSYLFSVNNRYYNHQRVWFGDAESFKNADKKHRPYKMNDVPSIYTMNEENTRLQTILAYPGLRSWWKEQGYADAIKAQPYIMSPYLYTEIYKGTLGETAGKYILEKETGIILDDITDPRKFEKADYVIHDRPDEYVDFKHYSIATMKDGAQEFDNIIKKLDNINGKRMYVINLIKGGSDGMLERSQRFRDGRIVVIPWMIDENGNANNDLKKELLING